MVFKQLITAAFTLAVMASGSVQAAPFFVTVDTNAPTQSCSFGICNPSYTPLRIDVNDDGSNDIQFGRKTTLSSGGLTRTNESVVSGLSSGRVTSGGPLDVGSLIDTGLSFTTSNVTSDYTQKANLGSIFNPVTKTYAGSWNSASNKDTVTGYMGFRFVTDFGTHLGWIYMTSRANGNLSVHTIGFETAAGTSILAGDGTEAGGFSASLFAVQDVPAPGALALLGAGLFGLGIRRRTS